MTAKIRNISSALLLLLAVFATALSLWGGQQATGGVASAAAPVGQNTGGRAAAPNTTFSPPDLVSWIGEYDNYMGIAASDVNGSVSIDWGAAPDDTTGTLYYAWNNSFGAQTEIQDIAQNSPGLINCKNQFGPCPIAKDSLDRTHLLYWSYEPGFCAHYVLINPGGNVVLDEIIPGTCDNGTPRKLLALAVDNNLTVHVAASRDNQYVTRYWQKTGSTWTVINETIPQPCGVTGDLTLTVSTQGVVMAAFKDCAVSGSGSDIWTATRIAPDNWTVEDISAACCQVCPNQSKAYLPNLAAAPDGGIRIIWADGRCQNNEGPQPDIYYREWVPGTGWEGNPIVRVVQNSGTSYHNALAVDASGEAHIVWADDTSSPFNYYRTFYVHGRGTTFSSVEIPFNSFAPNSWQRDVAIDAAYGNIHVAFSTVRTDPNKDVYYSYAAVGPISTPTPVPPTATPTPPCSGQSNIDFQDVCEGSTFFEYVRYVYQQGIMSGYACGSPGEPCAPPNNKPYFRPNNSATRGQMAKIVVLGADINVITPTVSYFEDVPVGSTFFPYVETAAANLIITGYPCGGPGEPCNPPDNKPYYRPNSPVTRGQLTKMVSVAYNFTEPVSGQTFEDVPSTSPFYEYVQRLAARGIISGYACGGPGEPCGGGNRPYFRTGNSVTRGQTAKIISESSTGQPSPTPTATRTPVPPPSCTSVILIYGVTSSGNLISFDASDATVLLSNEPITGLQQDESIVGIDFRPTNDMLYGLGSTSRLYTINTNTGAATQVGASGAFTLTGGYFGFDFNPTVDRIRVVSDDNQNLRLNPNDGTLTAADGDLAYAVGDPNEQADPYVVGAGYTNSYSGTGTTSLYTIDTELDVLTLQAPPNNGTLNTIGSLGLDALSNAELDLRACNNTAYAALVDDSAQVDGAATSGLYTINLATGEATLVDEIGGGNITVTGLAISPAGTLPATPTVAPTATATGTPVARTQPSR